MGDVRVKLGQEEKILIPCKWSIFSQNCDLNLIVIKVFNFFTAITIKEEKTEAVDFENEEIIWNSPKEFLVLQNIELGR